MVEKMKFEDAVILTRNAFLEIHPDGEVPTWFKEGASVSGFKNNLKKWIVRYSLVPFSPLKENQKWEKIRGEKVVVELDPITGKKSILISREGAEPIIFFEAMIDFDTKKVSIIIDSDFSKFDGSEFEI